MRAGGLVLWVFGVVAFMLGCAVDIGPGDPERVASTSSAVCTSATLSSSASGNTAPTGTPVTWTATAGCSGGDTPTYKFYELAPGGAWTMVQDWSTSATFNWSTTGAAAGSYQFEVWVRAQGSSASYESYAAASFTITAGTMCTNATLSPSPASPQVAGTAVTLTGGSSSCGSPRYAFYELAPGGSWQLAQAYSSNSTLPFSSTTAGTYYFQVWVRDASSGAAYDTYAPLSYTLTPASSTCTAATVSPSQTSPQLTGTSVTLTGGSSSCGSPRYAFYELAPGGSWQLAQAYSSTSTFPFSSTTAGTYYFQVWVRDASSGAAYDTYAVLAYTLDLACTSATLSASPPSPQPKGTAVTLTAGSSSCASPQYQFYELAPGGSWTVAQAWSSSPTFPFSSTTAGAYSFQVWVRDAGSSASYDTYAPVSYTLL